MFENDEPIDVTKIVQSSFKSRGKRTMFNNGAE